MMKRLALALLLGCLLLVAGASALDGYDYYQTIEYAACDQETYQQDIVIHRTTGTAYNETAGGLETWHIYVGDHCREDYGDVRFTNSTGAELAYYLWPDYDSSSARFCVRLEGADAAGVLQVWYGNPSATTTSNSSIVFTAYHGAASATFYDTPTAVFSQMRYDARVKYTSAGYNLLFGLADAPLTSLHDEVTIQLFTDRVYFYSRNNNVGTHVSIPYSLSLNTWYDISILHNGTTVSGYINGTKIGDWSTNLPDAEVGLFYWAAQPAGSQAYSLIRAYSATPPAAITFSGEQETAAPPATAFTATPTAGLAPLTVQFTDTSAGSPTSWAWTFGDSGTSTAQSPQHTYTTPGTYTVNLTATNEYGSDYELKTDYITVYGPVTAQFTANVTGGTAPVAVQFTDLSTGSPTSWSWTFGDGNTSTDQNPVHTYTTAGTHTVTLTASHPYDSDTETKTAYITIAVLQPFPGITALPRDLAGTGLYEDINGNNRLDYNDLTVFFQHLAWAKTAQPTECFDFNGNGWLDYNDVITLFSIITEEHP
jgi:PKD repeat protein